MKKKRICVVVPAYNEEKKIANTLENILANTNLEVIVVEDGCSDGTAGVLAKNFGKNRRVKIIDNAVNRGKGYGMRIGAEMAWKDGVEAVIFMDADGQHDASILKDFANYINNGEELIIGVRITKSKMSLFRRVSNWMIRMSLAALYGQTIEDILCGYRAMTEDVYKKIKWESDRYAVETEMMCNIWRRGINFRKVVVETIYNQSKKKKKDNFTPTDGLKILLHLPYWRWRKYGK